MSKEKVGFIGMGVMGRHMAGHVSAAGYTTTVHDINKASAEKAAAFHPEIKVVDSPKEVAELSDIVVTMLPSGQYVHDVAFGKAGLIRGFRKGSILLDTSSSESWLTMKTAEALKEKGIDMVDAPVSGAEIGAQKQELVFMVGGNDESVARVKPILNVMGKLVFHLGPVGSGHMMKSMNNLVTAITFMATAEALAIGKHFGLDPAVMTDVMNVSTGQSWISQTHIKQRIINRKFDDSFKLELMVKDIGIAIGMADEKKLPVPLSASGYHLWKAAANYAGEGASISEMVRWIESITKTEIQ